MLARVQIDSIPSYEDFLSHAMALAFQCQIQFLLIMNNAQYIAFTLYISSQDIPFSDST